MRKLLFIFSLGILAFACQPDEFPAIGSRDSVVPKLSGTWQLTSVIQRDNDAVRKGFPAFAQTQDITNDFAFSDFKLTLNSNAAGEPTTFTIVTGNSPNIIGDVTTGTWTVDDVTYPSQIEFADGTVSIELGSFAGLNDGEMQFRLIRYPPGEADANPIVTYQYIFSKQE